MMLVAKMLLSARSESVMAETALLYEMVDIEDSIAIKVTAMMKATLKATLKATTKVTLKESAMRANPMKMNAIAKMKVADDKLD